MSRNESKWALKRSRARLRSQIDVVAENVMEAERELKSGELCVGGVCGGVEMDVIRRKVGF